MGKDDKNDDVLDEMNETIGILDSTVVKNFSPEQTPTKSTSDNNGLPPPTSSIGIVDVLKYSDNDFQLMKDEIMKQNQVILDEMKRKCDERVEMVAKPLHEKITTLQEQITTLTTTNQQLIEDNKQNGIESSLKTKQYQTVLDGYIELFNEMEQNVEKQRKKTEYVTKGRDQLKAKLENFEKVYYELLQRSESTKNMLANFKENENKLKQAVEIAKKTYQENEIKYNEERKEMNKRNEMLIAETKAKEQETKSQTTSLKARIKFLENQSRCLQIEIEHKTKENKELSSICDELFKSQGT